MRASLFLILIYCTSAISSLRLVTQFNTENATTRRRLKNKTTIRTVEVENGLFDFENVTLDSIKRSGLIDLWQNLFTPIITNYSSASAKCQRSVRNFLHGLNDYQLWALKMFDATAKLPSGILSGNVNQFGDYDECLSVRGAQYCLAEINLESAWKPPYSSYKNLVHSHFPFRGNFDDPQHRVPDFSIIRWGICFPSDCDPEELQYALEEQLAVRARVRSTMCKKSNESLKPLAFGDYFARLFFASVLLAVAVSTLDELCKNRFFGNSESKSIRILQAFSLLSNWKQLTNNFRKSNNIIANNNHKQGNGIRAVHGIRALSAVGLLMCHKSLALLYNPYVNRTATMENWGLPWTIIGRTAIIYTDSFMLLSGLLTANSLLQDIDLQGSPKFIEKVIRRIFRITPNMVAVILFCTYILPNINSGPLWPLVIQHHSDLCKQNMWRNFLYVHNFYGFENMCLTHTHQIGIDMQLFMITPFLIYIWTFNKKWGVVIASVMALLSTVLRYLITIRHSLSHVIYYGISIRKLFDTANLSYILPSHRATIYINGILLAYALKSIKCNLSKYTITLSWTLALIFGALAMIGPFHMARISYMYKKIDAAVFGTISPIWWGVCLSWIIFASNRGYAGWFGDLLSWTGFQFFTKIAYSLYLVQFPVFFYNVGIQKNVDELKYNFMFHFPEIMIILTLSTILTLCIEMPFQKFKNILFTTDNPTIKIKQKKT